MSTYYLVSQPSRPHRRRQKEKTFLLRLVIATNKAIRQTLSNIDAESQDNPFAIRETVSKQLADHATF